MTSVPDDTCIPVLSLAEFQKRKDERVQELEQNTKKHFTDKIFAFYSDKEGPYKYNDDIAKRSATEWFDPATSIDSNEGGGNDENNPDFPAKQLRKQWLATENEKVMMLRFPLPDHEIASTTSLTLDQDDKSRETQNEEFKKLYFRNTEKKPTVLHDCIEDLKDLRSRIDAFLHSECSKTNLATIVFNGHGSRTKSTDGTRHGTLSIHRSGNVANNEIINIVEKSFCSITDNINPQQVDVVFAQCFGHLYSRPDQPESRVNIISLASKDKPKTRTSVKLCERKETVISAHHTCLEQCAADRLEEARGKPADRDSSKEPQLNTSETELQINTVKAETQEKQPSTSADVVHDPANDVPQNTVVQPQPSLCSDGSTFHDLLDRCNCCRPVAD